jgi:hypothetical protein
MGPHKGGGPDPWGGYPKTHDPTRRVGLQHTCEISALRKGYFPGRLLGPGVPRRFYGMYSSSVYFDRHKLKHKKRDGLLAL